MLTYIQGADLPDAALTLNDSSGTLIDLSTGYTFVLKIAPAGGTATVTKSTGMTGASTAPNLTVAWATSGELNTLAPGNYDYDVIATRASDSKQRIWRGSLIVRTAIT